MTTGAVTAARPFRVLGLQQVALGALDRALLGELWCELFGLAQTSQYRSELENVDEVTLSVGAGVTSVEVDLMQPIDPARTPRVHTPALHHIGLWVDDLPAAYAWLSERGLRFTAGGIRRGAAGHDVCFIHPKPSDDAPKSGVGVLIELVQAPPEIIEGFALLALERSR
ncbi:MAG TPA: VOC family protein [Polyangiaceae bacterium]